MSSYYVIGIRMDNRVSNALKLQEVLTKNGCKIRARLGLHEASDDMCANDGLIVLQPCGEKEESAFYQTIQIMKLLLMFVDKSGHRIC